MHCNRPPYCPGAILWRSAALSCYGNDMHIFARLVHSLVVVLALVMPSIAATGARAEDAISTLSFLQFLRPYQAKQSHIDCHSCSAKPCSTFAVACCASCATASALAPFSFVLASVSGPIATMSSVKAAGDRGRPPDPPPPRTILID